MSKLGWRIWLDKHSLWHKVLSLKNGDIKNVIHDNSMSAVIQNPRCGGGI